MSLGRHHGQNIKRERTVADVLLGVLALPTHGAFLVADDPHQFVRAAIRDETLDVHQYWRMATPEHGATAWPPKGPFDGATLRLSKDKTAFEMTLHALAAALPPGAPLWVYGANDEGIKSTAKKLEPLFVDVETMETRRHCRVLRAYRSSHDESLKPRLDDWSMQSTLTHPGGAVVHRHYPGLFAKGKLDPGTALLLDAVEVPAPGIHILDYACGAGVIAAELQRRQPTAQFTLADADAVAIVAAQQNVPHAAVHTLADPMMLPNQPTFDMVVSNPPIHTGKERDYRIVQRLIEAAAMHLRKGAPLWMVVQRQVPLIDALQTHMAGAQCVRDDGRFHVWRAIRP